MKLSQFKFDLPLNLIAQHPAKKREDTSILAPVFSLRPYRRKEKTGAKIEVFLLRELNKPNHLWDVIVDPARKIRVGNKLYFGENDELVAEVIDNTTSRGRTIRFLFDGSEKDFKAILETLGETPLPKYIK